MAIVPTAPPIPPMVQDTKHFDIDLAQQLPRWVEVPPGAGAVAVLWLHGRPLGRVTLPHRGNAVYRRGLARAIVHQFSEQMLRQLVRNGLATAGNTSLELDRLLALPPVAAGINANVLTVVVCTRGERPDLLERCLAGLVESVVSPAEVIVVGFGGGELGRSREVYDAAAGRGVPMRWIDTGDGDLARARRAGVGAVSKPLVAFVDESIRVDRHWVAAMLSAFRDHPQAAAVVGSVLPGELENGPSRLLAEAEDRMAWGERFEFHWWQPEPDRLLPREWLNALRLGSGANMTFRTAAIRDAQRVGPIARGDAADAGEHLDVWLRLLESGHAVIREPAASGRDAGVGSIAEAEARVRATAAGISAALVAAAGRRPSRLWGIILLAQWFVRTALGDAIRQRGDARTLSRVRLRGHLAGTWQGIVSVFGRRRGREVEAVSETDGEPDSESGWNRSRRSGADIAGHSPFAGGRVLPVELAPEPAQPQEGSPREIRQRRGIERGRPDSMRTLKWAQLEPAVDLLACWNGMVLGAVRAITGGQRLTLAQVRRLVVDRHFPTFLLRHLGVELHPHEFDGTERKDRVGKAMDRARRELLLHFFPPAPMAGRHGPGRPAADATASIVVPTCDRPDDLRTCLTALLAQRSDRPVEIIVVDNRPASGRTPPIVAEFPGVRLVNEPRQGSAYTRNRGLLACRGSIVVFCDDDVVVPDGWLAAMLAPFDEPNVGVVTGNIVPYSLETASQRLNEATCGLGRGSEPFAVDGNWFYGSPGPVQGWEFGTTANAAVRVEVFRDPAVGLFAESLGPGTPVGAGEDPYFFYRVLKSGYRIEYLPDAWVWHKHRTSAKALRRQVYNYAKSAVGYHLMTLFADGDRRARAALLGGLQRYYLRRLVQASLGRADVPPRIVMVEIAGNLAGGFSFLASEGRRRSLASDPAHPPTPRALPATVAAAAGDEPWALRPSSTRPPAEPPPATIARIPRRRMHGPGRLPHFLVIGAQKSGTTALHHNLQKHPSIELVPNFRVRVHDWDNRKETGFFDGRGSSYGIRTLDDYRRLFNDNGLVQGESCPAYESGEALDRIRGAIPEVRLVLICREPVSRLESAFNHLRQWHSQVAAVTRWATWDPTLSFEANVQAELDHPSTFGLVRMGMYAESITRVLGRFRPEQLLVLVAEEYRADPQATYDRIFDFLGVQPAIIEHLDVHIREHTTRLTDEQRQRMAEFYRPHNERFFQMIGREVPAWEGRSSPSSRVDPDAA